MCSNVTRDGPAALSLSHVRRYVSDHWVLQAALLTVMLTQVLGHFRGSGTAFMGGTQGLEIGQLGNWWHQ